MMLFYAAIPTLVLLVFNTANSLGQDLDRTKLSLNTREDLSNYINKYVSTTSSSRLDVLVSSGSSTISLTCGWERVRRTIPTKAKSGINGIDRTELMRFLGLVEGRLQISVPKLWYASVQSAMYNVDRSVWFLPGKDIDPDLDRLLESVAKSTKLRQHKNRWYVEKGKDIASLTIDETNRDAESASMTSANGIAFVGLMSSRPSPYKLYAIKKGSNRLIWSSDIWAGGVETAWSGAFFYHGVELQYQDGKVAVYGTAGRAYLEVFDAKDGKNLCRFGTGYWTK